MSIKYCVLVGNKICDNCGDCNICDLDSNKVCNNCCKCIERDADYLGIKLDMEKNN